MTPASFTYIPGLYLLPFCLLASFLLSLCTKCRRKAVDMTSGRAPGLREAVVELQPLSYQPSSDPQPNHVSSPVVVPHVERITPVVPLHTPEQPAAAAVSEDRVSLSLSSSVTDISYNKISVREPLARVLAIDHTYTEVDEERVSSFYEEIAAVPMYAKIHSHRGYDEIGTSADTRHVYSQPEPVYSTASIADPGYEAVGGYPDSETEPGYEAIRNRKREVLESETEPGYEVIATRKPLTPDVDTEPGYEAIPDRKCNQRSEQQHEPGAGYECIASRQLAAPPDPEYEVIKRSPEPLPPTPHLSRQESDLSTDPGYERVRFVPRFPSDEDPDDPVYAKIEKGPKSRGLEERFCERL